MSRESEESGPSEAGRAPEAGAYRVLFVCTGNTCRSPLAEELAREEARSRGWTQVEFRSAGTAAAPGSPASDGARRVGDRHGLDLSGHAATPLGPELVAWADVILVMTRRHRRVVEGMGGEDRVAVITDFAGGSGGEVVDPVGGGVEAYEATYRELEELVERALDRLGPVVSP